MLQSYRGNDTISIDGNWITIDRTLRLISKQDQFSMQSNRHSIRHKVQVYDWRILIIPSTELITKIAYFHFRNTQSYALHCKCMRIENMKIQTQFTRKSRSKTFASVAVSSKN